MGTSYGNNSQVSRDGLVHYFDFSDPASWASGSTKVYDLAGGAVGTFTNFGAGELNVHDSGSGCLEMRGIGDSVSNEYIGFGSDFSTAPTGTEVYQMGTGAITLVAWLNSDVRHGPGWTANGGTSIGTILRTRPLDSGTVSHGFWWGMAVDTTFFQVGDGSSNNGDFRPAAPTSGSWAQLVATRDGASLKQYLNGAPGSVASDTFNTNAINNSEQMFLGYNGYPFDGKISQIRIYNRAWTLREVELDYENMQYKFINNDYPHK